ncbi:hypothetical protein [Enterovibrio coralii]|uniref:Lipoprotein n=1 Tax=Enterovibrio coralii TaxID=294935 RepID=A0A135ICB8_9GAMM|nr:hypothetical protein [Enterovibrio coralii]KXF83103.1 hypothetical protein ATN88_05145 [Enterovibrio coralii]
MNKRFINCLMLGSALTVSGCQLTSQRHELRIYDPSEVESYQLPVLIDGVETVRSYRQSQSNETWFWTLLENDTFLQGENVVVQVVGKTPLKQPPSRFVFEVPNEEGILAYNAVGPFQYWTSNEQTGERCLFALQNSKSGGYWLSLFAHYCTSDQDKDITWVNRLKLSLLLEGF